MTTLKPHGRTENTRPATPRTAGPPIKYANGAGLIDGTKVLPFFQLSNLPSHTYQKKTLPLCNLVIRIAT